MLFRVSDRENIRQASECLRRKRKKQRSHRLNNRIHILSTQQSTILFSSSAYQYRNLCYRAAVTRFNQLPHQLHKQETHANRKNSTCLRKQSHNVGHVFSANNRVTSLKKQFRCKTKSRQGRRIPRQFQDTEQNRCDNGKILRIACLVVIARPCNEATQNIIHQTRPFVRRKVAQPDVLEKSWDKRVMKARFVKRQHWNHILFFLCAKFQVQVNINFRYRINIQNIRDPAGVELWWCCAGLNCPQD